MKGRQITGLLVLTFIWLTTCGFVSWGEAANAGIADVVEPMNYRARNGAENSLIAGTHGSCVRPGVFQNAFPAARITR